MALTQVPIELSSTPGIVDNSNDTAITIDSSENVLVGKTAVDTNTAGFEARSTGFIGVTRADVGAYFTRLSTDGEIIQFRKDSTTVGSILSSGGDGIIVQGAAAGSGLLFHNSDALLPAQNGNAVDATIDLGRSTPSAFRFKDIYLSGGVNFSANGNAAGMTSETLDDYEEGNFTPTIVAASGTQPTITFAHNTGTYTKVGRLVTLIGYIEISSISGTTSGNLNITGLPFAQLSGNGYAACGAFSCNGLNFARTAFGSVTQYTGDTLGFLTSTNNTAWNWELINILSAGDSFRFSITYHTAA